MRLPWRPLLVALGGPALAACVVPPPMTAPIDGVAREPQGSTTLRGYGTWAGAAVDSSAALGGDIAHQFARDVSVGAGLRWAHSFARRDSPSTGGASVKV